ncbi:hypothetical protein [Propionivibrio sp.]|uniref:hypothetical protein n=1 Tax=Propionivibrio sp. TaxID=2212460 RepID=UPI003BEF6260
MTLFEKLLGYIHYPVFDKDPRSILALRIRHRSDSFRWSIASRVLTGFDADNLLFSVALDDYTLRTLADHLLTIDGVAVSDVAESESLLASAATLISGSGYQSKSDGDAVYAYTSMLWMYLDALACELSEAKSAILAMVGQMSIKSSEDYWLDEWGGYFGVARQNGESDSLYSERIIFETIRSRGNNKSIEIALKSAFKYPAQIIDAPMATITTYWLADGSVEADGQKMAGPAQMKYYGEFDAKVGFDLMSADSISELMDKIRGVINNFRDAGTRLRHVAIEGGVEDSAISGSDASAISPAIDFGIDLFPPIRLLADGSVVAAGVVRNYCDGSIVANGSTSASGLGINVTANRADIGVDPMGMSARFDMMDKIESPIFADGFVLADGVFFATGVRDAGIDDAFITVRSSATANGRHTVGEGFPIASGGWKANGYTTCGSAGIYAGKASENNFRLI